MNTANLRLVWIGIITSLAGFVDASYLTYSHLVRQSVICSILEGCDRVLTSEYSEVYNIPVAFFGMIFYACMIVLFSQVYFMGGGSPHLRRTILATSSAGIFASIYFTYLQVSVLGAYCQYCLFSALFTLILLIVSVGITRT